MHGWLLQGSGRGVCMLYLFVYAFLSVTRETEWLSCMWSWCQAGSGRQLGTCQGQSWVQILIRSLF